MALLLDKCHSLRATPDAPDHRAKTRLDIFLWLSGLNMDAGGARRRTMVVVFPESSFLSPQLHFTSLRLYTMNTVEL